MPIHNEMRGRKDGNPTRLVQKQPVDAERAEDVAYPWHRVYRSMKHKSGIKPYPAPSQQPDPFHPNIDQLRQEHDAA